MSKPQKDLKGESSKSRAGPSTQNSFSNQPVGIGSKAIHNFNLNSVYENETMMARVEKAVALTYATKIQQTIRFLTPDQLQALAPVQVDILERYITEETKSVAADPDYTVEDREVVMEGYKLEWANWLDPGVCMMNNCGKSWHDWDRANDCITVPVVLQAPDRYNLTDLFPVRTKQERILCFACALAMIQKSRGLSHSWKKIEPDETDTAFGAHPDRPGLTVEIGLLRIYSSIVPAWGMALHAIPPAATELGILLQARPNDDPPIALRKPWLAIQHNLAEAYRYVHFQTNLARPIMLMGAHWFWNAWDIVFATGSYFEAKYQTTAMEASGPRVAERVMECWAHETERLFDGPMRILRGNNTMRDAEIFQKLMRAVLNNPPIELTGHQAELRKHWDEKMDSNMGPFWRAGPLNERDKNTYWIHPDMRPTNIALRLLEIMPGVLDKIFSVTQHDEGAEHPTTWAVKANHIEPWHVLNDRYFQFVISVLYRYVSVSRTELRSNGPPPMKAGLAKARKLL